MCVCAFLNIVVEIIFCMSLLPIYHIRALLIEAI